MGTAFGFALASPAAGFSLTGSAGVAAAACLSRYHAKWAAAHLRLASSPLVRIVAVSSADSVGLSGLDKHLTMAGGISGSFAGWATGAATATGACVAPSGGAATISLPDSVEHPVRQTARIAAVQGPLRQLDFVP